MNELSPRETEVLTLLAQGLTNKEIAMRLGITPGTVGTFVNRIYLKLQVRNRVEATMKAVGLGLTIIRE